MRCPNRRDRVHPIAEDAITAVSAAHKGKPDQHRIEMEGDAYLRTNFPLLDYIVTARIRTCGDEQTPTPSHPLVATSTPTNRNDDAETVTPSHLAAVTRSPTIIHFDAATETPMLPMEPLATLTPSLVARPAAASGSGNGPVAALLGIGVVAALAWLVYCLGLCPWRGGCGPRRHVILPESESEGSMVSLPDLDLEGGGLVAYELNEPAGLADDAGAEQEAPVQLFAATLAAPPPAV
eukprot:TRINITY_DN7776_c0_g1_i1.p1 TRINITY_DN7776_c0_g1~~TRINITY_DN7776_c0_g1_i1.p1  ORF type:complete len:237 (-),score=42.26 TRINITY_DN7776_c0_g1_i1:60-770(-)